MYRFRENRFRYFAESLMPNLQSHLSFVLVMMLFAATAKPAVSGPDSTDYAKTIHDAALKLADPSEMTRQVAIIKLTRLPLEAFPALEAAVKLPDLPEAARAKLKEIVERERPWQPALLRKVKIAEQEHQWTSNVFLEAYEKSTHRNPKWDADAIDGIKKYFAITSGGLSSRAALEKAIAAGCDEPGVLLLEAEWLYHAGADIAKVVQLAQKVHDTYVNQPPHPYQRELSVLFYFAALQQFAINDAKARNLTHYDPRYSTTLKQLLMEESSIFPAMAKRRPPSSLLCTVALDIITDFSIYRFDLMEVYMRLEPSLEAALPNDPGPLYVKGSVYVQWAWQARGSGLAATVTEKGWKLMGERLGEAEVALQKAYELDPKDPRAPTEMLTVVLGNSSPREEMEKWFKRAMEADPQNFRACANKAYYLTPKWNGSEEEELAFANECYNSDNWGGSLPFVLQEVHRGLADDSGAPETYYARPEVWKDIQREYEPFLQAEPDERNTRSAYCYYACRSGHWALANKEFELLGAEVPLVYFNSAEQIKTFRAKAAAEASKGTP